MKNYNHKKFVDWLETLKAEKQTTTENQDGLLVEAKLSKYWKLRAKRRAKNAQREWPNKHDRDWALTEQEKSSKINKKIYSLFEKELMQTEEMSGDVTEMMKRMKKMALEMKKKSEAMKLKKKAAFKHPNKKPKKNISTDYPPHKKGETVGGYYRKAAKKLGGIGIAPGEGAPGGIAEKKNNETK